MVNVTRNLVIVDNINSMYFCDHNDDVYVYWNSGCTDIQSIKILAQSYSNVYASPLISKQLSTFLHRNVISRENLQFIQNEDEVRINQHRYIAFFAANDTIARMLLQVTRTIDEQCVFILPYSKDEDAYPVFENEKYPVIFNKPGILSILYPSLIVMGNDWGDEEKKLIKQANALHIPSICIQEGCLDWEERSKRMQWSTFSFIQGPVTVQYLNKHNFFLTGNPRFDSITPKNLPIKPFVMINCNFTYNVYEENRGQWINDVTNACNQTGFDFFISQHPRDHGELHTYPVRRSNAGVVHSQIAESSIVVSRFSTVIYEAILMGRLVIYYNPHNESMQTFRNDTTGGVFIANTFQELIDIFKLINSNNQNISLQTEKFIHLHCGCQDGLASQRCANTIKQIYRWVINQSQVSIIKRLWILIAGRIEDVYVRLRNIYRLRMKIIKVYIKMKIEY